MKESEFDKSLKVRETVKLSKLDPKGYGSVDDLYMAILTEMAETNYSKDFVEKLKRNPRAKEDLTNMIRDIIAKQPEYMRKRYLNPQLEGGSREVMNLLKKNGVRIGLNEIIYDTGFSPVQSPKNSLTGERRKFIMEGDEYIREQSDASIMYSDIMDTKADMHESKRVYVYDKDGIENQRTEFIMKPREIVAGKYPYPDLARYTKLNQYRNIDSTFLEKKTQITRMDYFNGKQKNLANFATLQVSYIDYEDGSKSCGGNFSATEDLSELYRPNLDNVIRILRTGSEEQKRDLNKFYNADGNALDNNEMEKKLMPMINKYTSRTSNKEILTKRINKILGRDEGVLDFDE